MPSWNSFNDRNLGLPLLNRAGTVLFPAQNRRKDCSFLLSTPLWSVSSSTNADSMVSSLMLVNSLQSLMQMMQKKAVMMASTHLQYLTFILNLIQIRPLRFIILMKASRSQPHLCSHCGELHNADQHVRISNRFEELLMAEPILDQKGLNVRVKKRTQLKTTIKLESQQQVFANSGVHKIFSTASDSKYSDSREYVAKKPKQTSIKHLEPLNYFQQPSIEVRPPSQLISSRQTSSKSPVQIIRQSFSRDQTSLRDALRKAGSSHTLSQTRMTPISHQTSGSRKIFFHQGLPGKPKIVQQQLTPNQQVAPTINQINQKLYTSFRRSQQVNRSKEIYNSPYLVEEQYNTNSQLRMPTPKQLSIPKSHSAAHLHRQPQTEKEQTKQNIAIPTMFGPVYLNDPATQYFDLLPSPPTFMKQPPSAQLRKCTYGDNRCFGFNCGRIDSDPYEIMFQSNGHMKDHIFK